MVRKLGNNMLTSIVFNNIYMISQIIRFCKHSNRNYGHIYIVVARIIPQ